MIDYTEFENQIGEISSFIQEVSQINTQIATVIRENDLKPAIDNYKEKVTAYEECLKKSIDSNRHQNDRKLAIEFKRLDDAADQAMVEYRTKYNLLQEQVKPLFEALADTDGNFQRFSSVLSKLSSSIIDEGDEGSHKLGLVQELQYDLERTRDTENDKLAVLAKLFAQRSNHNKVYEEYGRLHEEMKQFIKELSAPDKKLRYMWLNWQSSNVFAVIIEINELSAGRPTLSVALMNLLIVLFFQIWAATFAVMITIRSKHKRLGYMVVAVLESITQIVLVFADLYYFIFLNDKTGSFKSFNNGFDALYYSVTTFTTTGYGDISAVSNWAKGITMLEMIVSYFVVTVVMALLVSQFLKVAESN